LAMRPSRRRPATAMPAPRSRVDSISRFDSSEERRGLGLMILHTYRQSGLAKKRGLEPESVRHDPSRSLGQLHRASEEATRSLATPHCRHLWTIMALAHARYCWRSPKQHDKPSEIGWSLCHITASVRSLRDFASSIVIEQEPGSCGLVQVRRVR
jgi:hypothetical protein